MIGPVPIFYAIEVTQQLVHAMVTAQYPKETTIVKRLVPPVADERLYHNQGINPVENREVIFQCFEALKALLVCIALRDLQVPFHGLYPLQPQ